MGIYQQYHMNSSPWLNDTLTSNLSKEDCEFVWNNPNELDLFEMKKSSIMPSLQNQNNFLRVLPCIQKFYTIFDSLCPNIYRIHCSDSLRTLNELICLTGEYLQLFPSSIISTNELLYNEKYFDDFISKLKQPISIPKKYYPSKTTELRCFGQGIQSYHYNNELNQTSLFCFELTTTKTNLSLPIDVSILDPDENLVSLDIKYINTYNQGYTQLFSCSYTPISKAGLYRISLCYNNIKMLTQPYTVFIRNATSNYCSYKNKGQLLTEEMLKQPQQGIY